MRTQIPLGISLQDSATFANFCAGPNRAALAAVQSGREPCVYLWGARGSGRTHLLQAACHAAAAAGGVPVYLPLGATGELSPEIFEGLEQMGLVCLDDIDAVVGQVSWETGLFHLYNRLRDGRVRLLITGGSAPAALGLRLPDLVSRLSWGPVFQLQRLEDAEKVVALQLHAVARGLDLPQDVGYYLLRRCPRDMHSLISVLDRLDHASLAAQRRLTIPFVRDLLGAP